MSLTDSDGRPLFGRDIKGHPTWVDDMARRQQNALKDPPALKSQQAKKAERSK